MDTANSYQMIIDLCDGAIERGEPIIIDGDPYDPAKLKALLQGTNPNDRAFVKNAKGKITELDRDP